jgi:hypothetical protein
MANEQEKEKDQAEADGNDNKAAGQPSITDILHSGGFHTVVTIESVTQLRRVDLGSLDE